ncbi:cyclic GMP-AMP synthase-like receptor isoform X1 [Leptinotarsa decemlineata]|uniref:cyclic GMP-AMP synthase-like receptor isoform X1 n=2 Tax=Leptinotarsa decemlineata TaxID=7539 RepID=UPI003D308565
MSEVKKYNIMENTLQAINENYVKLPLEEVRRNNVIMKKIIWGVVEKMRKNVLFDKLFSTIYYGGSYYDGLKVGHPDEYDIDMLLVLPKNLAKIVISTVPGYVHAILTNKEELARFCESDTNYLDTEKILNWIHGVLTKALNEFTYDSPHNIFITYCRAGPAFTLKIRGEIDGFIIVMDIDLVTCIKFGSDCWPTGGYRPNPCLGDGFFFIVPKLPKSVQYHPSRYWRLSFQAQEKSIIHGKEKLKPALKLLKKMRNTLQQPIDSYHLKTIVLWEVLENPQHFSYDKTLSYVFMHILKLYKEKISKKKIEYFWNKKLNLIDNMHDDTYLNIQGRLENIIKQIDNNPLVIASYLLEKDELIEFTKSKIVQEIPVVPPEPESSCIIL